MTILNMIYGATGGGGWKPGANTVAYYPLTSTSTVNDLSGNSYNLSTTHTSPTFGTYQGVNCASFNGSNTELHTSSVNPSTYGDNFTISLWIYSNSNGDRLPVCNVYFGSSQYYNRQIRAHSSWSYKYLVNSTNGTSATFDITANSSQWYHLLFTNEGSAVTTYVNGVQIATGTNTRRSNNGQFTIGAGYDENDSWFGYYSGGISNVIVENKVWTAQEISDYFNQTKGDYGIS